MNRAALLALALVLTTFAAGRSDIVEGNPASPVKVTIYEDLACPDCARFRLMMDEKILPKYGRRVAFVHRDFPLPRHEWARPAAVAARWVAQYGTGPAIAFRREIMAEQEHISLTTLPNWLRQFARRNKLDEEAIQASLDDPALRAQVDSDLTGGAARGVSKVPSVYIGSQSFVENIQFEDLVHVLDEALGR